MLNRLKGAIIEKLDEQRVGEKYCLIRWSDTKKLEVVPQSLIASPPSDSIRVNVTYTIFTNGERRHATVIATGSREECEQSLEKLSPGASRRDLSDGSSSVNDLIDEMVLVKILNKLMTKTTDNGDVEAEDTHNVQCDVCGMKPIVQVDRYRCLECPSSSGYDMCGNCFERRRVSDQHQSGHAMIHFRMPNEFLGISVDDLNQRLTLNQLRNHQSLQNERHDGITCDGECRRANFTGLRFKCDTCPNYNLCERCAIDKHIVTKSHQRNHPMILTSNRVLPNISPDDIEMGDVLGRGAFGYVCKARWIPKNRQVACKVIEVSVLSSDAKSLQDSFIHELAAYRELSGPYVLRTYGYATRELVPNRIRGKITQFMILMEFMGRGSLQNVLNDQSNKLSLRRKLTMARQIASGMRRIHQHGMIHRDIRPDNILVTEKFIAKIGDMGIARVLEPTGQQTQIGCLPFMPPEFYQKKADGRPRYDEKLDIYTYGLTINQLFTETAHDFQMSAISDKIRLIKHSPIFYDEIISRCLENDPHRRPTAMEIEKTLEMYEQSFSETMRSDRYIKMNTREKDQQFIDFYRKNRGQIQRLIDGQLVPKIERDIHVEVSPPKKSSSSSTPASSEHNIHDTCRVN